MKRWIILLIATIIGVVFVAGAYTPPSYDDVGLPLASNYTSPSYDNVLLPLAEVPIPTDSCTCPGLNEDWVVQLHDYCNLTDCNLGTGTLSFNSTGAAYCKGEINTTDLGDPGVTGGSDAILWIVNETCIINED